MFDVSTTYRHPFDTRDFASSSESSFWIAQGNAMSTGTSQGFLPGTNCALKRSAYGLTTSLLLALSCSMKAAFSGVLMPSSSKM